MLEEYDIDTMNPRPNPYAKLLRTVISPFEGDERSELPEKCEKGVSAGVQGASVGGLLSPVAYPLQK